VNGNSRFLNLSLNTAVKSFIVLTVGQPYRQVKCLQSRFSNWFLNISNMTCLGSLYLSTHLSLSLPPPPLSLSLSYSLSYSLYLYLFHIDLASGFVPVFSEYQPLGVVYKMETKTETESWNDEMFY